MQFESSHQPNLNSMLTVNCIETTKVKKKRPGMALFKMKLYKRKVIKKTKGRSSAV